MACEIVLHPPAIQDIQALLAVDPVVVKRLLMFLQELKGRPELLSRLHQAGYEDDFINVDGVWSLQKIGLNVYRLKLRGLDMFLGEPDDADDMTRWIPYRVIYAYDPSGGHDTFHVLAVVQRTKDTYDPTDEITRRIAADCGRLGLDNYRR